MKTCFLPLIALLLLHSPVRGGLTTIEVSPATPMVGKPVTVTVAGVMPDLCWTLVDHQCGEVAGQNVGITLRTFDCNGQGCLMCFFAEVPIEVSCPLVFDAPGTYLISAREIPNSLWIPSFPEISATVEVFGVVDVESASWSTIKSFYR
ncbi:MAG: hypothetical protein IPH48_16115 [bacterium]|nr:hypothetical protein [bacterium]MBK9776706.1 hypothetical protein [bacterium]